jgi:catechol 2,3-dioxygenase-like lactoylglutathione lyase family enzyme
MLGDSGIQIEDELGYEWSSECANEPTRKRMKVLGLDHVQLAMPKGQEEQARSFYGGVLGLEEIPKPAELAGRGGVWFRCGDLQLHLGVEEPFVPARKAHPGIRLSGYDAFVAKLSAAGVSVRPDTSVPLMRRSFVNDPFGNRLELVDGEGKS